MICKTFEVRDVGTFIPVLAIKLAPNCEEDRYLLSRSGYGKTPNRQAEYVLLCTINGGQGDCTSDPYNWPNTTMQNAHDQITKHFDEWFSGYVVDVEFLLGKTTTPKRSERLE